MAGLILIHEIAGESENQRLALFLAPATTGPQKLYLCQQNFAEGIGWFTQSRIEITSDQVAGIRQAFGQANPSPRPANLAPPRKHDLRIVG